MNTKIAIIHANEPSSTGTVDYTESGFGTPVAAIILGSAVETLDSKGTTAATSSIGFTDGTNEKSSSFASKNGESTSRCRRSSANAFYIRNDKNYASSIDAVAEFDSWITDGIRLDWTTADSGFQPEITVILIGGTGVTAEAGQLTPNGTVGNTTQVSGLSNEPEVVLFLGNCRTFDTVGSIGNSIVGEMGFGIFADVDSSFKQGAVSISHDHNSGSAYAAVITRNDRCWTCVNGRDGNIECALEVTAKTSSSFTVTTRDSNNTSPVAYLSLNLNGDVFDLVQQQLSNSTGTQDFSSSDVSSPLIALLAASTADGTNSIDTRDACMSVGIDMDGASNPSCHSAGMDHNLATTQCFSIVSNAKTLWTDDYGGNEEKIADTSAWGSGKYTINYSTNDGTTQYGFALLIGDSGLAISPNGIASGEAFGSPSIGMGIEPSSIGSAEAFGNPTLVQEQFLSLNGIASSEAFGNPSIGLGITTTGIASAEAFGSPTLNLTIYISSINSGEAFGSPTVNLNISLTGQGIVSEEAVGTPTLVYNQFVEPNGIASGEAFGNPQINMAITGAGGIASEEAWGSLSLILGPVYIQPNGITSEEAFGSLSISTGNVNISPTSIPSGEAFGSPSLGRQLLINSIPSGEAFGTPTVYRGQVIVTPDGIVSGEAFGNPTIIPESVYIAPTGISSEESFGTPTIVPGAVTIQANSINSSEAFGSPTVDPGTAYIAPNGIASVESFGNPSLSTGNVNISLNGIASAEAFGVPYVTVSGVQITPFSISSSESFGSPSIVPGLVSILPASISSGESFGIPTVIPGGVVVSPNGIASEESFGSVNIGMSINVQAIVSGEGFGSPTVTVGGVNISPEGIASEEYFGSPIVRHVLIIDFSGTGIASAEAFGNPIVSVIVRNEFMTMMETDLQDGFFNEDEFAETAVYEFKNGSTISLPVIFDNETVMVDPDTGAEIISRNPMVQAQTSDFIYHPDKGDKMVIRGVRYQVVTHEPDGTGVSILHLHHERTV